MEHFNTSLNDLFTFESKLNNIISINDHADIEDDTEDYDFDYDPNEMYYALNKNA